MALITEVRDEEVMNLYAESAPIGIPPHAGIMCGHNSFSLVFTSAPHARLASRHVE
jgi:hypothetical protein